MADFDPEKEKQNQEDEKRTLQQNRALHLWFTKLANALAAAGYDVKKTLRQDVEIPWTPYMVKELLWRPVQKQMIGKDSTANLLKKKEIDDIYDVINLHVGNRTGVHVPFPSIEELMYELEKNQNLCQQSTNKPARPAAGQSTKE